MKTNLHLVAGMLLVCSSISAAESGTLLCEPWASEYSGTDADGEHVIALWQFNEGAETADSSEGGHSLRLEDALIHASGRFDGCLESFRGWPVGDKKHRAMAKSHSALSPQGAFTLEMWIKPKKELDGEYPDSFLLDKKYVADDDYQLILGRADRYGSRVLRVCLGFGGDSATFYARPARFEVDNWYHVAFTYDGEGTGSFYIDGKPWGSSESPGRKSISAGRHILSIGDRIGSYYHGFPGYIDQVRICAGVREFRRVGFQLTSDRRVFVRMEPEARLRFSVTNLARTPLEKATATISLGGHEKQKLELADIKPGDSVDVEYLVNTTLRADEYPIVARVDVDSPDGYSAEERLPVRIVPRKPPNQFPVLMWGVYGNVTEEMERLKRIGFSHVLGLGADYSKIMAAGEPTAASAPETVEKTKEMLDNVLANGLTVAASLSPGSAMRSREEFRRVDREGKPFESREDICGLMPELQKYCYNVGASVVQTYGHFPAFGSAMIHTEVRGHARPCFHEHDRKAFREHAGIDIPDEAITQRGVDYTKLKDFPESRVIPDDHPLYVYYRWYWKQGDGWNQLNTRLHEGLKSTGRDDLWTYHDPAVRVASVHGSGGNVDVLSQWTYSYPDPIRIGLSTDELFAMAAGSEGQQQVMKMTQIIWYRSQTAPEPKNPADAPRYKASWELEQPSAPFITIPPMHLREAFWTKMARPIRGIMYHGWQSLVPTDSPGSYRYTHPATQHELARLIRDVVRPLGPTLLQVPGVKSDVAFLECFASEMFARRGTYGWNGGWAGDFYHILLYAHLQPEVVFDETIVERGLDGFRVLVMPDCDVLTAKMVERINAFQAAGGIVVGDDRTCPAVKPDITIPSSKRSGRADEDKKVLLARAAELREKLDGRYTRQLASSTPEVIPYLRRYRDTDYVFVVNDRREYGRYVGHHGIVMENGLPAESKVSVARPAGFVYDLKNHRAVASESSDGKIGFDSHLGPCDGNVYMIANRAIDSVLIEAPETVKRGDQASLVVRVVDAENKPIDAVVPLEITVWDAERRMAEYSGYYGAADGQAEITLDVAPNDPFGTWQIQARELASGRTAVGYFRVLAPEPWPPARGPVDGGVADAVQPDG